jgi:sarcosine oxidase subunit beta
LVPSALIFPTEKPSSESFTFEAMKLGTEFRYRESVIGLLKKGKKGSLTIEGVKTTKGKYKADAVVNAAGAHASQICKLADLNIPINPDSHEAGITAPVKPFLDPLIVDIRPGREVKTANFYFGQNSEGQIIFCYTPIKIFPGENRYSTSEFMPIMARRMVDLIPRFKNELGIMDLIGGAKVIIENPRDTRVKIIDALKEISEKERDLFSSFRFPKLQD